MKILFAASEAYPFIMSGGLGEVAGALPKELSELNNKENDVRVIIPLYSRIPGEYKDKMTFMGAINVPLSWRMQYCGVFYYRLGNVGFYFVDNEYYFKRENIYGEYDDGERFAFFSKAVLEVIKFIDFRPDIIHCNDWHTALVPVYLKTCYRHSEFHRGIRTLFTIHNIQYQGIYDMRIMQDVFDIAPEYSSLMEYSGNINLMKGAIVCADFVGTVSPSYAEEIKDEYYAHGLEWILRDNRWKLRGILNGIDTENYNPGTDGALAENYSSRDISGKMKCKEALQRDFGLPVNPGTPVIGMVSRLVGHKGFELVSFIMDELMERDVQLVVLGTGEEKIENEMKHFAGRYPQKMSARIEFSGRYARRIYSGADIFLMPSKSEPCGLAQMVALRYGAVPVVRETGGLKDSIQDYGDGGTGFTFKTYNAHDMLGAVDRALELYRDRTAWEKLAVYGMSRDFSWRVSAEEYMKLYRKICEE